eukprot:3329186-Pleurochrysis_carterae.AAC.1
MTSEDWCLAVAEAMRLMRVFQCLRHPSHALRATRVAAPIRRARLPSSSNCIQNHTYLYVGAVCAKISRGSPCYDMEKRIPYAVRCQCSDTTRRYIRTVILSHTEWAHAPADATRPSSTSSQSAPAGKHPSGTRVALRPVQLACN